MGEARSAESLAARVEAYWQRRQAKDLEGAYSFYCPGYKQRVQRSEFLRLTRLTRFDLREVRVEPPRPAQGRAAVTVQLRFMAPFIAPEALQGRTTEWWSRDADGEWCKEDEPLVLPFPPAAGHREGVGPPGFEPGTKGL